MVHLLHFHLNFAVWMILVCIKNRAISKFMLREKAPFLGDKVTKSTLNFTSFRGLISAILIAPREAMLYEALFYMFEEIAF